jgi:hypothetical protein
LGGDSFVKDISAKEKTAQERTWVQKAHENTRRQNGAEKKKKKGKTFADGLIF